MILESKSDFARRLGVSKQCVSDYVSRRKLDGAALVTQGKAVLVDVEVALGQLKRRLDPDQRISGNAKANLRPPAAPAPVATGDQLWAVLYQVPGIAAWDAAAAGGDLQRCFDAAANLRLNITGELHLRFGAVLPGDFEHIDWPGLAEDYEMAFVDPLEMLADWNRRRLAPSDL
ncbi:hypothetical protein [Lichenibacterium ramalinae]|uniref:Uncharacterized protein n=1 Tax=Lichenibacterium ramalinae TaxID=2316527 RepID=A0A4Q2RFU5_9HYPH|nr:hypothetical protein [Lichenibacterium ramalinae]RYB06235.1 hypothetical protein D3272_05570 [Lichenibacterium ramalinae]